MSGNALRQNALKKGVISINHITIEELNLNEAERGGRALWLVNDLYLAVRVLQNYLMEKFLSVIGKTSTPFLYKEKKDYFENASY